MLTLFYFLGLSDPEQQVSSLGPDFSPVVTLLSPCDHSLKDLYFFRAGLSVSNGYLPA